MGAIQEIDLGEDTHGSEALWSTETRSGWAVSCSPPTGTNSTSPGFERRLHQLIRFAFQETRGFGRKVPLPSRWFEGRRCFQEEGDEAGVALFHGEDVIDPLRPGNVGMGSGGSAPAGLASAELETDTGVTSPSPPTRGITLQIVGRARARPSSATQADCSDGE